MYRPVSAKPKHTVSIYALHLRQTQTYCFNICTAPPPNPNIQIAGVFFTEGSYTKNTKEELQDMVDRLETAFASQSIDD